MGAGPPAPARCPLRIGKVSWEGAGGEVWGQPSSASRWVARPGGGGPVGAAHRALLHVLLPPFVFKRKKKKTLKGGFKPKGSPYPTLRTTGLGQFLGVQGALTPAVAWLSPWQASGPVTWVLGGFRLPLGGRAFPVGGRGEPGHSRGHEPLPPFLFSVARGQAGGWLGPQCQVLESGLCPGATEGHSRGLRVRFVVSGEPWDSVLAELPTT